MKCQYRPNIVMVPYPAWGHVTPMLQLAATFYDLGLHPVVVVPKFIYNRIISKSMMDDGIDLVFIPDGLGDSENCNFFTIHFSMENDMPLHFERLLRGFLEEGGVKCVLVDLLASWAMDVACRCQIPVGGFWPAMLATYNLISAIPDMIQIGLISDMGTPLHRGLVGILPGQPVVSTEALPWLVGNFSSQKSRFMFWLQILQRTRKLQWLLVNSFSEDPLVHHPRVFQVGPLTRHSRRSPTFWKEDRNCLDWLRLQKPSSVIYISFGSWVGPIREEIIHELALGLEATRRPFIWVLGATWRAGLPAGYLDRVTERAKVVTWAPQKEVLGHPAVGCYLTHCGWNSTVEAIECEKPLLCYPVSGDQFINCSYVVRIWGIGLQIEEMEQANVEEGIRRVAEDGGEMQCRLKDLKTRIMGKEANLIAEASLKTFLDAFEKNLVDSNVGNCPSLIDSSL